MKRAAATLVSLIALGSATAPAAGSVNERRAVLDSYCSPTGDYCLGISKRNGGVKFEISSVAFSGAYKLCVRGPSERTCRKFTLSSSGGQYADRVDWERKFGIQGDGTYSAVWKLNGAKLGKTLRFQYG